MAKKLTIEVDAETSRAKRKVKELAETGADQVSGTVSPAASKAARSLENAAAGADKLNKSAQEGSSNVRAMAKTFGGMALRMAASYASNQMEKGSTGQQVVKGAGDVVSGAMMGSVFGPLGAVAGGLMGLTSAILDATAAEKARIDAVNAAKRDYAKSELYYEKNREFESMLKSLTTIGKSGVTRDEGLAGLDAEIEKFKAAIAENKAMIETNIKSGNLEQVSLYRDFLGQNRTKLARLEAAKESIEGQKANGPRETHAALDALSRIGGGSFGGDYAREQLTVQKEMAASLKAIENKGTQKSGDWQ